MTATSKKDRAPLLERVDRADTIDDAPPIDGATPIDRATPIDGARPIDIPTEPVHPEERADTAVLSAFAYVWYHRGEFLVIMDFICTVCSFMFAYYVRFNTSLLPLPANVDTNPVRYFTMAAILAGLWVFLLWMIRGYKTGTQRVESILNQTLKLLISGFGACCALMIVAYAFPSAFLSRAVYLLALVCAPPSMLLVRLLIRAIEKDLAEMKVEVVRVVGVGLSGQSVRFARRFSTGSGLTRFVGFVGVGREGGLKRFAGFPVLGDFSQIPEIYERNPFDMLIVCSAVLSYPHRWRVEESLPAVVNFCENHRISILYDMGFATDAAAEDLEAGAVGTIPLPTVAEGAAGAESTEREKRKTLIVGFNHKAQETLDRLLDSSDRFCQVVGFVSSDPAKVGTSYRDVPVIATLDDLKGTVDRLDVEEVIVAFGTSRHQALVDVVALTKGSRARVRIIPAFDPVDNGRNRVSRIRDLPLLPINPQILNSSDLFLKRFLDIAASMAGLALFAPFLPLIALAIKIDSRGPVFYHQERVGRFGRIFRIHKLRTMKEEAEKETGPVWSSKDDPRITLLGRFLRKTRIDEIPQLWNVLFNEMSLVGPRPERPHFVNQFLSSFPLYRYRTKLKPGVTGWAQVRGKYDESMEDVEKKLLLDIYYLEHFCMSMDVKIILNTVKVMLQAKGQ